MDTISISRTNQAAWSVKEILALFEMPFMDLLFKAQQVHRQHQAANYVQLSSLLSIKTGGCPEDCNIALNLHVIKLMLNASAYSH